MFSGQTTDSVNLNFMLSDTFKMLHKYPTYIFALWKMKSSTEWWGPEKSSQVWKGKTAMIRDGLS